MRFTPAAIVAVFLTCGATQALSQPCTQAWLRQFSAGDVSDTVYQMAFAPLPSVNGLMVVGRFHQGGSVAGDVLEWGDAGFALFGDSTMTGSGEKRAIAVFDFDGPGPQPPQLVVGGMHMDPSTGFNRSVMRWTGTQWVAVGTLGGLNEVYALASFDSGSGPELYAGASGLYRWSGSAWQLITNSPAIWTMAVFDEDGPGGAPPALFLPGDGSPGMEVIAKWNGSSFLPVGAGLGTGEGLYSLHVADLDGNGPALYAGGTFDVAHGATANHIAKWDGTSWSALGSGVSAGSSSWTNVLAITDADEDGAGPLPASLIIGGDFSVAGGSPSLNTARWRNGAWESLGGSFNGQVWCVGVNQEGGQSVVYAGGEFTTPGSRMVRLQDSTWTPMSNGANAQVRSLANIDMGTGSRLWVGGDFTTVAGGSIPANGIASWDGSQWNAAGWGVEGSVESIVGFNPGAGTNIYVAGGFGVVGGVSANNVAALSAAGWSALGPGTDGLVHAAVMFDDDGPGPLPPALYVGGEFTTIAGQAIPYLARWDGTTWSAVGGGFSGFPVSPTGVLDMVVWDDGSGPALYVAGGFLQAGSTTVNCIAKWNGASWSSLSGGTGSSATQLVRSLTVYDDGSGSALYAGGRFTEMGGVPTGKVARWNGAAWSSVGSTAWSGGLPDIWSFAAFNDGGGTALYACGTFTQAGGVAAVNLARWRSGAWSSVGGLGTSQSGDTARALAVYNDGSGSALYATGSFVNAGGVDVQYIARWNGSAWSAVGGLQSPLNGQGYDLQVFDDGSGSALYLGGMMTVVNGGVARGIARWTPAGWAQGPSVHGASQNVQSFTVYDPGTGPTLLASGSFTLVGQQSTSGLARWDGTDWHSMGIAPGSTSHALAVYDDGTGPALYAAGDFTTIGGVSANRIARWNGSTWSPLGTGTDMSAKCLAVFDDGTGPALYAGGAFTTAGGIAVNRVAKWKNGVWSGLAASGPSNGFVYSLAVFNDIAGPALYVGGSFTALGGPGGGNWPYLARWNGSAWSSPGAAPDGRVLGLAALTDSDGPQLFAGGDFTHMGSLAAGHVARWDGSTWLAMDTGTSGGNFGGQVLAMAAFEDQIGPAVYIGGSFTTTGAISNISVGRWGCTPGPQLIHCYANCDGSVVPPILNVNDFGCFLNKFAARQLYANCDGSTTPPVLNVLDFACFLNKFAAGCQ